MKIQLGFILKQINIQRQQDKHGFSLEFFNLKKFPVQISLFKHM